MVSVFQPRQLFVGAVDVVALNIVLTPIFRTIYVSALNVIFSGTHFVSHEVLIAAKALKADLSIPIVDVHLNSLKLCGKEQTVVGDKVARLFQFVHSLPQPMLARYQIREV